jgi:molybdate transport system substrate-binding protein
MSFQFPQDGAFSMLQITRELTRYDHLRVPCTGVANRVARTAAAVVASVGSATGLTILCLTVLAPLFGPPLVLSARAQSPDIVVFGSIALQEALKEANDSFQRENGTRVVTTIGASTALAKQIEGGTPGDVFFAGDTASMDYLAERNLIKAGTRKDLLRNRLVLIAPADSKLALTAGPNFPLADAIGSGQLAIADPVSTPAGKYTQASLEYLAVWTAVRGKIAIPGGSRAVLTKVAGAEFPLGIIWQTDAADQPGIRIVATLPEASHPPIIYPLAVLANSTHERASSYLEYLLSPKAASFFQKRGFAVY